MIINFKKLCKKCDSLLNDNIQNIALNAISYLHVLRAHPEILRKYLYDVLDFYLLNQVYYFLTVSKTNGFGGFICLFLKSHRKLKILC
jgi:hypothetical protein